MSHFTPLRTLNGNNNPVPIVYDFSFASLFTPELYGAKGDGVSDDLPAFNKMVAAMAAAGGGTAILGAKFYTISAQLLITHPHIRLVGAGKNTTYIIQTTVGESGVAFVGAHGAPLADIAICDLSILQESPTASGIGLQLVQLAQPVVTNVQVSGFFVGIFQQRATNLVAMNTLGTFNTSTPIPGFIAWDIFGDDTDGGSTLGGNASSCYYSCGADASAALGGYANVSPNCVGFKIHGAYCGDLFFFQPGISWCYYGMYFDLTTCAPNSGANDDINIYSPTVDFYTWQAISIIGDTDGMTKVNGFGGWIDPLPITYNPSATLQGLYCDETKGVQWTGLQGYTSSPLDATQQTLVYLNNSTNCDIAVNCDDQKVAIAAIGCTDCFVGGRMSATDTSPATVHVNLSACTRVNVKPGSVLSGYSALGYQVDATCVDCTMVGSSINPTHITMPVKVTAGATGTRIALTPGYNPVGHLPGVAVPDGAGNPYVNQTGTDQTWYVSGGTVTVIQINGVTTGLTSGTFRVPVGSNIEMLYSVAPMQDVYAD